VDRFTPLLNDPVDPTGDIVYQENSRIFLLIIKKEMPTDG